jgi:ribosomal protein S18 acetylase RimI-like enzyme
VEPHHTLARLEAGLARSWVRQAGWVPRSQVRRLGGLLVALSGIRDQTQQVAVVDRAASVGGATDDPVPDPEASVVAAEVCFEQAGWRPAFDLAAGAHPMVEQVLADRGFQVVVTRPGMVRSTSVDLVAPAAPGVRLELGVSPDRDAIIEVQRESFDLHPATARGLVPNALFADPEAAVIVAREHRPRGGHVVGSVTVHLDLTAAIVGAAVLPTHRHRGIGSALTTAALALARHHGADLAWLQASPDGEPLYRRLGFVEVAPFQVWLR